MKIDKNIIRIIPGFKSLTPWKMILATIFYALLLLFSIWSKAVITIFWCLALILIGILRIKEVPSGIIAKILSFSGIFIYMTIIGMIASVIVTYNGSDNLRKSNTNTIFKQSSNALNSSNLQELSINNNSAKIKYSTNLWKEADISNGTMIQVKSERKIVAIGAERMVSTETQDKYISNFKKFMENKSSDGKVEEGTLNNYPLLSYTQHNVNADIIFTVLVVKDGPGYYEVTFACFKDLYLKYKDEAFTVMKSFQVVTPSLDQVEMNDELLKGMKTLDKLAGIDKDSVEQNISESGKELVGEWGSKDNDGNIHIVLVINADGSYKRYKTYGDEKNVISGTWKYSGRVLTLDNKKAIIDGVDNMVGIIPIIEQEILNFKENEMFVRNLTTLTEVTYYRK